MEGWMHISGESKNIYRLLQLRRSTEREDIIQNIKRTIKETIIEEADYRISNICECPNDQSDEGSQISVRELFIAENYLVVIYNSGYSCTFNKERGSFVREIMDQKRRRVKSAFHNTTNNTLIIVYVNVDPLDPRNSLSVLKSAYVSLTDLPTHKLWANIETPLFKDERIIVPGFIEFDDANKRILTKSIHPLSYKIWDMKTYKMLFELKDKQIEEIRFAPKILVLLFRPNVGRGLMKVGVLHIDTGEVLMEFVLKLKIGSVFDFIEVFNLHIIMKYRDENMGYLNIRKEELKIVPYSKEFSPLSFLFLNNKVHFIALFKTHLEMWGFDGGSLERQRSLFLPVEEGVPMNLEVSCIHLSKSCKYMFLYSSEGGEHHRRSTLSRMQTKGEFFGGGDTHTTSTSHSHCPMMITPHSPTSPIAPPMTPMTPITQMTHMEELTPPRVPFREITNIEKSKSKKLKCIESEYVGFGVYGRIPLARVKGIIYAIETQTLSLMNGLIGNLYKFPQLKENNRAVNPFHQIIGEVKVFSFDEESTALYSANLNGHILIWLPSLDST